VTKGLWWKHIAAVQSVNEVCFMKLKVARHFKTCYTRFCRWTTFCFISTEQTYRFHFNRTNL